MARLFGGFGKKKKQESASTEENFTPEHPADLTEAPEADSQAPVQDSVVSSETDAGDTPEHGPFDGDTVNIDEFDFSDFSAGILDLGSMRIPLPKASQVQVEMAENGPRMLHIITHQGRITPVAFAAPTSGGMWEDASQEILEGMTTDGAQARFEDGLWGQQIVSEAGENVMRIIGIDGPRWMLRLSLIGPADRADKLVELTQEMAARMFIYRGANPVLAGNSLPVTLPAQLVAQVQEQMKQRQEQARVQAAANAQHTQRADEESLNEAASMLRNLVENNGSTSENPRPNGPNN